MQCPLCKQPMWMRQVTPNHVLAGIVAAFREAVRVRASGIKHRVFIGLSSGYDSGAIMLALRELGTPFLAYHVRGCSAD